MKINWRKVWKEFDASYRIFEKRSGNWAGPTWRWQKKQIVKFVNAQLKAKR